MSIPSMRAGTELSLKGSLTSGKILKNHNFFHYITGTLVTGGICSPLGKGLGRLWVWGIMFCC